jgi:hypothetical protein
LCLDIHNKFKRISGIENYSPHSESRKIQAFGQMSSSTLSIGNTEFASTAFRGGVDYFPYSNLSLNAGFYSMTSPQDASTILSGFDVGAKWFPVYPGTVISYSTDSLLIDTYSLWSPYTMLSYRSRNLTIGSGQIGYSGYGVSAGINLNIGRMLPFSIANLLFLNLEAGTDFLSVEKGKSMQVDSITVGAGTAL